MAVQKNNETTELDNFVAIVPTEVRAWVGLEVVEISKHFVEFSMILKHKIAGGVASEDSRTDCWACRAGNPADLNECGWEDSPIGEHFLQTLVSAYET